MESPLHITDLPLRSQSKADTDHHSSVMADSRRTLWQTPSPHSRPLHRGKGSATPVLARTRNQLHTDCGCREIGVTTLGTDHHTARDNGVRPIGIKPNRRTSVGKTFPTVSGTARGTRADRDKFLWN